MDTTITLPSPPRFEDETDTSSLSDCDSEWTQISQSGDESDSGPFSGSFSHRDTDSVGGEPWEGVLSETQHSADSGILSDSEDSPLTDSIIAAVEAEEESLSPSDGSGDDDAVISAALDISLTGTLEAVRTHPANTPLARSLTDSQAKLRLSFPDPLIRSSEDLTKSYEDVNVSRASASPTTDEQPPGFVTDGSSLASTVDLGLSSTPDIPAVTAADTCVLTFPSDLSYILSVVMYGSSPASRWSIVEKLLKVAFHFNDDAALWFEDKGTARVYRFHPSELPEAPVSAKSFYHYIQIIDRTAVAVTTLSKFEEPSLAIVFMPCSTPLPSHTLYLPVISRPLLDISSPILGSLFTFSEKAVRDSIDYSWEQLGIPLNKLVTLRPGRPGIALDETELGDVESEVIADVFTRFIGPYKKPSHQDERRVPGVTRRYANALLLIAAVAAGLFGVLLNTYTRVANYSTSVTSSTSTLKVIGSLNSSVLATLTSEPTSVAIIPSSLKDYALAVFQPSLSATTGRPGQTTAGSTVHATHAAQVKSADAPGCDCDCKPPSWSDRLKLSTDLVVRPASTTHVVEKPVPMRLVDPEAAQGSDRQGQDERSLSTRIYDSLSLVINMNEIIEVVSRDLRVLFDAIDELLRALGRQADKFRDGSSKATKRAGAEFADRLAHRHSRAKENARKLKAAGGRFLSETRARLKGNVRAAHNRRSSWYAAGESIQSEARLADDRKRPGCCAAMGDGPGANRRRKGKGERTRQIQGLLGQGIRTGPGRRLNAEEVYQNIVGLVLH